LVLSEIRNSWLTVDARFIPGDHRDSVSSRSDRILHDRAEDAVACACLELDPVVALARELVRDTCDHRVGNRNCRKRHILQITTESKGLRVTAFPLLLVIDPRVTFSAPQGTDKRSRLWPHRRGRPEVLCESKHLIRPFMLIEL
jgi:hypothetical protein